MMPLSSGFLVKKAKGTLGLQTDIASGVAGTLSGL